MAPRVIGFIETEGRRVVARGWGEEERFSIGTVLWFGKILKKPQR